MRLTNSFLASENFISNSCSNADVAIEAMKRTMRSTMDYLHARYVMDLFKRLQRCKIGTTNIVNLCRRICEKLPARREKTLIETIIRWKVTDACKVFQKAHYENTNTWRQVCPILEQENIRNQYEELWDREKTEYARQLRNQLNSKIKFLQTKFSEDITNVPDLLQDIVISDQDLPDTFTSDPRMYGNVELTEQEMELLSLPPKFAVFDKIDTINCEAEVEKGLGKLRWAIAEEEQRQQGIVRQERTVLDTVTSTFDFRQMRGTDLPFNKRITLPKPLGVDTEARLHTLKAKLKEETNVYICDNKNVPTSNLTRRQKEGLNSISEKVKAKEIVIFETDKSGRFFC